MQVLDSWNGRALALIRGLLLFLAVLSMQNAAYGQMFEREVTRLELSHDPTRFWVDVNADGRDDFCMLTDGNVDRLTCYFSTGTGFSAVPLDRGGMQPQHSDHTLAQSPIYWRDINGDGYVDYCRARDRQPDIACNYGPTFNQYIIFAPHLAGMGGYGGAEFGAEIFAEMYRNSYMPDLNLDGRADFCFAMYQFAIYELRCHLAKEGGFLSAPDYVWPNLQQGNGGYPTGFFDFNGDEYPDFCRVIPGGATKCVLGSSQGFTAEISTSSLNIPIIEGTQYVDFNGDGKVDLCRIAVIPGAQQCYSGSHPEVGDFTWCDEPSPSTHYLQCHVSNGVNWDPVERRSPPITDLGNPELRWWVDINQDGMADFCRGQDNELRCQLGRGDSGLDGFAFSHSPIRIPVDNWGIRGSRAFCDAAGTGIPTFCRATLSSQSTQTCLPEGGGCWGTTTFDGRLKVGLAPNPVTTPSVITALNAGIGMETRITYAPTTDDAVYAQSGMGSHPHLLITQPKQTVVKETRAWRTPASDAERTGTLTGVARYFYKDLRSDVHHGARGFRERSMYTEGSNTVDRTVFFQGLGPGIDATSRLNDMLEVGQPKQKQKLMYVGPPRNERQQYITDLLQATARLGNGMTSEFRVLSNTVNELADSVNDDGSASSTPNPRQRYIGRSVSSGNDLNGAALPSVETDTRQDRFGNVVRMTETTTAPNGQRWSKVTTNDFGSDVARRRLGRLLRTSVTSTAPSVDAQIAALPGSAGNSPNATATSSSLPAAPQPIRPEVLMSILQLLLED